MEASEREYESSLSYFVRTKPSQAPLIGGE